MKGKHAGGGSQRSVEPVERSQPGRARRNSRRGMCSELGVEGGGVRGLLAM